MVRAMTTILFLASTSAAAVTQAGFHVGARVVSSAKVAAVPAARRDRIRLEVASHGAQEPFVLVGAKGGFVPSSGEVKSPGGSGDDVVVTFLY
jgi:hypothetical protein